MAVAFVQFPPDKLPRTVLMLIRGYLFCWTEQMWWSNEMGDSPFKVLTDEELLLFDLMLDAANEVKLTLLTEHLKGKTG